jgi:GAF domain-containing protein
MIDRTRSGAGQRIGDVTVTNTRPTDGRPTASGAGTGATDPDDAFDVLVETACDLLDVDYVGVHLLTDDTHRVLATSDAVPHPPLPRSESLCGVLLTRCVGAGPQPFEVVEVSDTAAWPGLPFTTPVDGVAPVRFYAAAPLFDAAGVLVGSLCAIAHHPRVLTPTERRTLALLGLAASHLLQRCENGLQG